MFSVLFLVLAFLALLDAAGATAGLVRPGNTQLRRRVPQILHERIRRQVLGNVTAPTNSTTPVNATSGIVPIALASDQQ